MAKIWVKPYTRPDGTTVKGHWRQAKSGTTMKDIYGDTVTYYETIGNMMRTNKGLYHSTKLRFGGKAPRTKGWS